MNVSPSEAEEALAAIQAVARKTRRSIASGGTYLTLIVTGIVWLVGFTCTQFLPAAVVGYIWAVLSIGGSILGAVLGTRIGRRVHSPATGPMTRRVSLYWLLLILFAIAAIAIAHPADGKQATMLVVLFIMLGQMSMGLLFSFANVWWTLPITALALVGYFFFPTIFYLLLGILGGGGMIALGLYIRLRR